MTRTPALETMKTRSCRLAYTPAEVWSVIEDLRHWQADAFHNQIVRMRDEGGVGSWFEMTHTNHPIIPWRMADQTFMGVITAWEPGRRQVIAELNVSPASGYKRTPDHQQTIEIAEDGARGARMTYSVATIRVDGISPATRFFFRPWARFQLGRAIEKKRGHIARDLAAKYGAR